MLTFLFRLYQVFFAIPMFFILTLIVCLIIIIGSLCGAGKFVGNYPARCWGWLVIRLLFLPVKVEGLENIEKGKSYVFVANHQGVFDILLIYGFLGQDIRWMMKYELGNIPIFGTACRKMKNIMVDNRSVAKIKKCYQEARSILKGGTSLVVFPEAARTWTGKMRPFKKGAFMLADELQLPVVPMTINGSFTVKPRAKDLYFCFWSPLKLTIHKPIKPMGQGSENIERLMKLSYEEIERDLTVS